MTDNPLNRLKASIPEVVNFIEWLADQPCKGNGSSTLCRFNAPHDPSWCCYACRAYLLRYGEPIIEEFDGDYRFLSNFYEAEVEYKGVKYQTAEHAFQAQKTTDLVEQQKIIVAKTPGQAKRLGKKVTLKKDWDNIKYNIMLDIVMAKFSQHPELKKKLLATGNVRLIEGNTWGDRVWGMVIEKTKERTYRVGYNWLGVILMKVRDELPRLDAT